MPVGDDQEKAHESRMLKDMFKEAAVPSPPAKTYHNSSVSHARKNVPDIQTYGDGDMFRLLSKVSSQVEGWMKSTKAMEIPGVGCVVQVTTQQGMHVAEALTFVPGVRIEGTADTGRRLVAI